MDKDYIDFHPSVVIAISPITSRLMMSVYDETYPLKKYRLAFNPLGGNPDLKEKYSAGPIKTLEREISEEFAPLIEDKLKDTKNYVKNHLIGHISPVKDILVTSPGIDGGRGQHKCIYSLFQSSVSEEIISLVEENILLGKKLVNEGFLGVTSLDDLYLALT